MKNNRLLVIGIVVAAVLVVGACTRSASAPPSSTNTPASDFPLPGTQQAMDLLAGFATQTAQAVSGDVSQSGGGIVTPEPEKKGQVVQPGETSVASATKVPTEAPTQPAGTVKESYSIPATYTLKEGEFPYCLARRYDINPADLLKANNLSQSSQVYPGAVLTIPKNGRPFPGKRSLRAHPTTYRVTAGQTVYSIACLFGDVDPRAIVDANNLKEPYKLKSGQKLSIP